LTNIQNISTNFSKARYICKMESKRQAKFSRQIQKDLSEIFMREGQSLTGLKFIGVSGVRSSPDLGYVKAYLTFLNEKDPQKAINLVRQYNKEIRTMLAAKIRHSVKKIPELEFFYDDTMDFVEKMDKLFEGLDIKPEDKNPDTSDYKQEDK
jgi:ribosome-binding factor A